MLHFTVNLWLFSHFTAAKTCCFHFTYLPIFPALRPKFGPRTLYIFKKALFMALCFIYAPLSLSIQVQRGKVNFAFTDVYGSTDSSFMTVLIRPRGL